MANVAVWPAVGASVPVPNSDSPPLSSSGATTELTDYIRGLLVSGRLLTYDPLGDDDTPDVDYFEDAIYCSSLTTRTGEYGGQVIGVAGYTSQGDGGEGIFWWDATATASANAGTIFGNAVAGRWRRQYAGNTVDARWFGGAITATVINTAQSVVSAAGGGTVIVPRGAYTINGHTGNRILAYSNVRLVFEPGCTISTGTITLLSRVFYADAATAALTNYSVEGNGLVLTMSKATNLDAVGGAAGIGLGPQSVSYAMRNVKYSDITINDAWYDGVYISGNNGTTMENVVFERITCNGCRRTGAAITHASDVRFIDCHFDENGDGQTPECGVDIEVNATSEVTDIYFERCTFNGNAGDGFLAQAPYYGRTARIVVVGCTAEDNGTIGFTSNVRGVTITRCEARRNTQYGFSISSDIKVSDCLAEDNVLSGFRSVPTDGMLTISNCISRYNYGSGFLLNNSTRSAGITLLQGCHSHGNFGRGIQLSNAHNSVVSGNRVTCNAQEGIQLTSGSQNNTIYGNIVEANSQAGDAGTDNILLESASHYNNISGNIVRQGAYFHRGAVVSATSETVFVLASHASSQDDTYNGCYIRIIAGPLAGATGVVTDYVGSTQTVTVSWSPAIGGTPSTSDTVSIVGSRLYAGPVASGSSTSVVLPSSLASHNNDIYNNAVVNVYSGTGSGQAWRTISDYVGSTQTCTLGVALTTALVGTGAHTTPTPASQIEIVCIRRPRYGIRVNAGCIGNRVFDNDALYGGATSGFSDAGTSTDTHSPNSIAEVLSGSATWDPGSLADGAGETIGTPITVTGAAFGDFVEASFSQSLQGVALTAWVSAANTVSARLQNETGGTVDLNSGTLRVRVRK